MHRSTPVRAGSRTRSEQLVLTLARENEVLREELRQTRAAFIVWAEAAVSSCQKLVQDRTLRRYSDHQNLISDLLRISESLRNAGADAGEVVSTAEHGAVPEIVAAIAR